MYTPPLSLDLHNGLLFALVFLKHQLIQLGLVFAAQVQSIFASEKRRVYLSRY